MILRVSSGSSMYRITVQKKLLFRGYKGGLNLKLGILLGT